MAYSLPTRAYSDWADEASRVFVIAAPCLAWLIVADCSATVVMWTFCFAIYGSWKLRTLAAQLRQQPCSLARASAYLFLWPGMNRQQFFDRDARFPKPRYNEVAAAIFSILCGTALLLVAGRFLLVSHYVAGGLGMAGLIGLFHFGIFHLLSILWRFAGIDARPIMNAPLKAQALADFWGRRWNAAFHSAVNVHLFKPLAKRTSAVSVMLAVFFVSGLIHDLVISIPARGGYGLPTLYFLIQGAGILWQRRAGEPENRRPDSLLNRAFTWLLLVLPLPMLFHRPFLESVIAPIVAALTRY